MSRSSLVKRLKQAKKAWKSFTTKLHNKLNKLETSRAIKKTRNKPNTTKTTSLRSSLSLFFPRQSRRRTIKPSLTLHPQYYRHYLLRKRHPSPIYIDDLFKQPDSDIGPAKKSKAIDYKQKNKEGTSEETENMESDKACIGDDMWESMELASPQMDGIDQRAENFISRFRAEMDLQEMIARGL